MTGPVLKLFEKLMSNNILIYRSRAPCEPRKIRSARVNSATDLRMARLSSQTLQHISSDGFISYMDLVLKAVAENTQSNGASRQKIEKYIQQTCEDVNNEEVRLALRNALVSGILVRVRGFGLNGSFAIATERNENSADCEIGECEHAVERTESRNKMCGGSERAEVLCMCVCKQLHDDANSETISKARLKSILKTPKRRFAAKDRSRVPGPDRSVKFAKSPKVVLISPAKLRETRRSKRLINSCVEWIE